MTDDYKQLAQARNSNTTATSIYSPPAGTTTIIRCIVICNTSAAAADVRIFLDNDGTTYDQNTALVYDAAVPAGGDPVQMDGFYVMDSSSGNLAYRTSVGNALTVTLFGVEMT